MLTESLESQAALFDPAFIVPQEEAERLAKEKAREVAQKNAAKAAEESAKAAKPVRFGFNLGQTIVGQDVQMMFAVIWFSSGSMF